MALPMHKFRIIERTSKGQMSRVEAADLLDVDAKTVQQLQTIWQDYLPKLVPLVDALLEPKNTKRDQTKIKLLICRRMNITYRQVNRLLKSSGIAVPRPVSSQNREKRRENARTRRKIHEKWALDVIFGHSDIENAAIQAEVSQRQMYRLCNKLTHGVGLPFRELARLTDAERQKVALQIEETMDV